MDLGLKGKVALVAAASQGLGFAVAYELAREGADVVICSRSDERIKAAAGKIKSELDVEVTAVAADLSVADEVRRLYDEASQRHQGIDILVTNSGGPPSGSFDSLSPEDWARAIDAMLMPVLHLSRLALPGMKERRWGRVLNITSISVKQPVEDLMLSNSVRAAVTGFARTLANEVAKYGITVNNILPGYTLTERVEELAKAASDREHITVVEARSRWESQIPMRRMGTPAEFAAVAAFLVSERASYVTGTSVQVDGGWIKSLL